MANTVTITKPVNSGHLFLIKVDIEGDGTGEETNTVIVDVSALTNAPSKVKIRAIQWSLDGFSADLDWDATANVHAFSLPTGSDGIRFSDTGSHLLNNAGAGVTGDLLITTLGLGAGDTGTIYLEGQHA